jgi:hypothetical protein
MPQSDHTFATASSEDELGSLSSHKPKHSPLPEDNSQKENTTPQRKSRLHTAIWISVILLLALGAAGSFLCATHPAFRSLVANPIPASPTTATATATTAAAATPAPVIPKALSSPSPQFTNTSLGSPTPHSVPSANSTSNPTPQVSQPNSTPAPLSAQSHTAQPQIAQVYPAKTTPETALIATASPKATPQAASNQTALATSNPTSIPTPEATPNSIASPAPQPTPQAKPAATNTDGDSAISLNYEETSLYMQQVDVVLFPKATQLGPQTLHLNVPIVHEKRLLSLTASQVAELTQIITRIEQTRAKQIALGKEMQEELTDYNALIQKGTPEAVLNTDSPSLINNTNSQ